MPTRRYCLDDRVFMVPMGSFDKVITQRRIFTIMKRGDGRCMPLGIPDLFVRLQLLMQTSDTGTEIP